MHKAKKRNMTPLIREIHSVNGIFSLYTNCDLSVYKSRRYLRKEAKQIFHV